MALTATDLKPRTQSVPTEADDENTFATLGELDGIIKFRIDSAVWDAANEDLRVRAAATAYSDLMKLAYRNFGGLSQSRDYSFPTGNVGGRDEQICFPPIEDSRFAIAIKKAQAAQVMFLLNGSQVRDMAREGITMSKGLVGADMWFTGYKGAVCTEAMEQISRWVELMPRLRRF